MAKFYQVFMFAEEDHAKMFCKQFGGERMQSLREGQARALGAVEEKGRSVAIKRL